MLGMGRKLRQTAWGIVVVAGRGRHYAWVQVGVCCGRLGGGTGDSAGKEVWRGA